MAQFTKASIVYSSLTGEIIRVADDSSVKEVPAGDAGTGYYNEMVYFADCLKNGAEPELCTPLSSLQAIELCYKRL